MSDDESLTNLYNEQLDLYPKLSQEDIVALYESEGITSETTEELIEKLNSLIDTKKIELEKLKNSRVVFGNDDVHDMEYFLNKSGEQTQYLEDLYKAGDDDILETAYDLQDVYDDLPPIYCTKLDEHIKALISSIIDDVENDIIDLEPMINDLSKSVADRRLQFEKEQKGEKIIPPTAEELEKEIALLEVKLKNIKFEYKNYGHKLCVTSRGYVPRDREFPSNELRNKIVCGYLGFARYWAKVYYYKPDNTTPFDDLVQIAYMALMSAAHYYIPNEKAKFTTYARRCIENKLKEEVYHKRKMKKRPYKAENFFDEEKARLSYLKMFIKTLTYRCYSEGVYSDHREESNRAMLEKLKKRLLSYNREVRLAGDTDKLLPSYTNKHIEEDGEALISKTVKKIIDILKQSNLPLLIDDEDRYFASLIINYENKSPDVSEIFELVFLIDTYLMKLDTIKLYLEAESELAKKNGGIVPTDDEIFAAVNSKIKAKNIEKVNLNKSGFYNYNTNKDYLYISEEGVEKCFELVETMIEEITASRSKRIVLLPSDNPLILFDQWCPYVEGERHYGSKVYSKDIALKKLKAIYNSIPSWDTIQNMTYTPLVNYYSAYMGFYDVDPFITAENYVSGNKISKQKEYDDISKDYDNADSLLQAISVIIEEIENTDAGKITLSKSNDSITYTAWEVYVSKDDEPPWKTTCFSREEALNELRTMQINLSLVPTLSREEFLKLILKQRKAKVNAYLREVNTPILEHNKKIAINRAKCREGNETQRLLSESEFLEVQNNVNILYESDEELMLLLTSHKGGFRAPVSQSTEDEALSNIFMQDYYKALHGLPKLEREVLQQYFDENGYHCKSAKEIGMDLGIAKSKVYQLKTRALDSLRKNTTLQGYNF